MSGSSPSKEEFVKCVLKPAGYVFCFFGWCWFTFAVWLRLVDATTISTNDQELVKVLSAAVDAYEAPKKRDGLHFFIILNPKDSDDA